MREAHATDSTQPSGSTGSSGWTLSIIGITLFTTISALGGVELFNGKLDLGGVSTTAISALIAFMSMSALCLIFWGASKWVEGENTSRHMGDFLNFIKNLRIYLSISIGASAAISALVTWGTGTTLSFLKNTPLSAIAAKTSLSTFLVGTVVLTIALLILKALGQYAVKTAQSMASSLKEAQQANGLEAEATAQGLTPATEATAQGQSSETDGSQAVATAGNEEANAVVAGRGAP